MEINIFIYPEPAGAQNPAAYRIMTTAAPQTAPVSDPRIETLEGTLKRHGEAIQSLETLTSELFGRIDAAVAVKTDAPVKQKKQTPAKPRSSLWTPEEIALITPCLSAREARSKYLGVYPGKRTGNSIKHKWDALQREVVQTPPPAAVQIAPVMTTLEPGIAPVEEIPPKGKNRKRKYDFQIPFKSDDPRYQGTWGHCKEYGMNYPELVAAKLDYANKPPVVRSPKKSQAPVVKVGEVKQLLREITPIDEAKQPTAREIIRELTVKQNGKIIVGQQVRHNGAKSNPHFGKLGTVKKSFPGGRLMVAFGNDLEDIQSHNVVVVPEGATESW